VARAKRRAFRDWTYWGLPVPGFGDPRARLYILGLAPAAHGANRTGRVFTGDRSGDFLFAALHRTGFANQARSESREDGLRLRDAYVAAAVRCAPPANRPTAPEAEACREYLVAELELLSRLRAVLALGKFAHDAYLRTVQEQQRERDPRGSTFTLARYPFGHGARHRLPWGPELWDTYHPSQQNTFTGRLTEEALDRVLRRIRRTLEGRTRRR
jgi:uracil-DNA glycosylase family 4